MTQFQAVVSLAVGRLKDKSVLVVKSAVQLLAAFLSNNPFSSKVIPINMVDVLDVSLQAKYLQYAVARAAAFMCLVGGIGVAFDSTAGSFLVFPGSSLSW